MAQASVGTPSISAMELRRRPGSVMDRVFYRNEQIIVEKSGEPRVAIIPYLEFRRAQQARQKAKQRLFAKVSSIRQNTKKTPKRRVAAIVQEAITASRDATSTK